jgi:hypothetical protein
MNRRWLVSIVTVLASSTAFAADAPTVRLHSAGSLRVAMTDIDAAYTAAYDATVVPVYGASGGLGDRLAKGEAGDVFTSADMGYPEALTKAGISGPTVLFARNHLCAILRPGLPATPKTVLATLLKPDIKIGTASPDNDPGGAYAWAMFKKADNAKPGSRAKLEAKALKMGSAPGQLSVPPNTKNCASFMNSNSSIGIPSDWALRQCNPAKRAQDNHDERWRAPRGKQNEPDERECKITGRPHRANPQWIVERRTEQAHDGGIDSPHDGLRPDALPKHVPKRQRTEENEETGQKDTEKPECRAGGGVRGLDHCAEVGGKREQGSGYSLRRTVAREEGILAHPAGRHKRLAQQR